MLALFRYEPCQIRKNQLMNNFRGKEAEHVTQKAYDRIVHIDTHLPQFQESKLRESIQASATIVITWRCQIAMVRMRAEERRN